MSGPPPRSGRHADTVNLQLPDKVILITGGGAGIAPQCVLAYIQQGASIPGASRHPSYQAIADAAGAEALV